MSFSKSMKVLVIFTLLMCLPQKAEATTRLGKALCEDKFKRIVLSFLDPNSLGKLTYTSKDLQQSVNGMDYFIENKKFLNKIFKIKLVLSQIEFLGQNKKENKKMISELEVKLDSLLKELYPCLPVVMSESEPTKYDPELCGNKARDKALAKTFEAKRAELQQVFTRCYKSRICYDIDHTLAGKALADYGFIRTEVDRLLDDGHEDFSIDEDVYDMLWFDWRQNPSITVEESNRMLENCMESEFVPCDQGFFLFRDFSNEICPEEKIENFFEGLLETTERNQEVQESEKTFQEKKFSFALGIASNPVAILKFGSRLLNWLIQNEEMLLFAENDFGFASGNSYFPLSALMCNPNLPKTTSKELADYLILNLKQLTRTPAPVNHFTKWACFRCDANSVRNKKVFSPFFKRNTFSTWLIRFAKTAHGSEVILEKLETILSDPSFTFEYKKDLIQGLFEGFDWDYYFKNYSIDHDVKRPGPFPEKPALAILKWISDSPDTSIPLEILSQLVSRGGLSLQALNKAIEIIFKNSNLEMNTQMFIKLTENSTLYDNHKKRILLISESYPEELKRQIHLAVKNKN